MNDVILDVRERDEFEAEHIENSIHVPLSHFLASAPGVLHQLQGKNLILMCLGGTRARLAAEQIRQMGFGDQIKARVFEGGLAEWKRQGKPTLVFKKNHLPIMRQVQLIAGSTVLVTTALGAFLNPWFLAVAAFFGAGLTVAGATGFCGMAIVLARMPWNKTAPGIREELCQASPKSAGCKD